MNCLCQCGYSANNINKLSLVGMQLPEKYIRRISMFRAKALRLESLGETSKIPTNESLFIGLDHIYLIYTR